MSEKEWIDLYERAQHSFVYRLVKNVVERWRSTYVTMVDIYVWGFNAASVPDLVGASAERTMTTLTKSGNRSDDL